MSRVPLAERVAARGKSRTAAPGKYVLPHTRARLENCLARPTSDLSPPSLNVAWLIKWEAGVAIIACDAYKLALLPVEGKAPKEPVPIARDALKALQRAGGFLLALDNSITVELEPGEEQHFDPDDTPFGNPNPVVVADKVLGESEEGGTVGVNARWLRDVAEGLGASGPDPKVRLSISGGRVRITPLSNEDAFGIVMPTRP